MNKRQYICLFILTQYEYKMLLEFLTYTHVRRTSQVALVVRNQPAKTGDIRDKGSIPQLGRSPGGMAWQYSCLENPRDREAWWAKVHRVEKSWTQLKQLSMHAPMLETNLLNRLQHLWETFLFVFRFTICFLQYSLQFFYFHLHQCGYFIHL